MPDSDRATTSAYERLWRREAMVCGLITRSAGGSLWRQGAAALDEWGIAVTGAFPHRRKMPYHPTGICPRHCVRAVGIGGCGARNLFGQRLTING